MDYHDIGVTICNTVDKCCPTNLTEEQRTALISAVAVWLDKQQAKGREAGLREAAKIADPGKMPCDCIKQFPFPNGPFNPCDCFCGNSGDIRDAAEWCSLKNISAAILAAIGEGK